MSEPGRKSRDISASLKKFGKDELKSVRSHAELAQTANGVRMLTKNIAKATVQLDVRAIMVVTKPRDNALIYLTREIVEWLLQRPDDIVVYVDQQLKQSARFDCAAVTQGCAKAARQLRFWTKKLVRRRPETFDLVVTLGGDGTVLYASNLFQRIVPPVMSFALGSLGFLTNFRFEHFRKRMTTVLDSGVKAYMRMRFTCRVHTADGSVVCEQQVLNELVVDRGPSPYITNLELYGDGSLLTVAQADGLIIATPTGSTAYSLSAGGSLVHPTVSAISVTPICPHTLSFRPILLPDGMFLKVKVPLVSRATAWASFDGRVRTELKKGDYVTVQASSFPFPTVRSSKTEYFDSVSRNLKWNVREQQKPFSQYLTGTNKSAFEKKYPCGPDDSPVPPDELFDLDYSDDDPSVSTDSDSLPDHFLPSPASGATTPTYGSLDTRTCFAHPNATISLHEPQLDEPQLDEPQLDEPQLDEPQLDEMSTSDRTTDPDERNVDLDLRRRLQL